MKLLSELETELRKVPEYLDNQDRIMRGIVQEDSLNLSPRLLKLIFNNELLKATFYQEVEGFYIFDKIKFSWVLSNRSFLPDNYTRYKNKIGLTNSSEEFLVSKNDVLLSFPNKDCVLEFDSTDINEKRPEVFFNEILSKDTIDVLYSDKVLTGFKNFDKNGENENLDMITDNLVIKGNNLISMYSLLNNYEGRIKLMYWDILYNTDNDIVPYNDSIKHSSWLVMMKNRLEVAKRLLDPNSGVICIQCDKNEDAYLKVLMDEIFGRENFVNSIALQSSTPSGLKLAHREKTIIKIKDTLLVYKVKDLKINPQYEIENKFDTHFNKFFDKESNTVISLKEAAVAAEIYDEKTPFNQYDLSNKQFYDFILKNKNNVFQTGKSMPEDIRKLSLLPENKDKPIEYNTEQEGNTQYAINGRRMSFLSSSIKEFDIGGKSVERIGKLLCDIWTDINFNNTQNEGGVSLPAGKKPEALIKRIIEMFTDEQDIVLDAYLGSGTTGAVAMKINRKFIGIEQLDDHYEKSVERLQSVIMGEQSGISKAINWQGGGEFTTFELYKNNLNLIDKINSATDININDIHDEIINSDFISYKVDVSDVISSKNEFIQLTLNEKKSFLIEVLDKNMLYVNYSDIDDARYNISIQDKLFTKKFYEVK